jgi:hypothetical protein
MESQEIVICSKLYKTRKEQQIFFGFFNLSTRTRGNNKQSNFFFGFFEYQIENRRQSKPKLEN